LVATLSAKRGSCLCHGIALKGKLQRSYTSTDQARLGQIISLPGYRLRAFYDQSEIINGTIHTCACTTWWRPVCWYPVILNFVLGDLRAALIVNDDFPPLSIPVRLIGKAMFGFSPATLMILGGDRLLDDRGWLVVMIENAVHHRERSRQERLTLDAITPRHLMKSPPVLFGVGNPYRGLFSLPSHASSLEGRSSGRMQALCLLAFAWLAHSGSYCRTSVIP